MSRYRNFHRAPIQLTWINGGTPRSASRSPRLVVRPATGAIRHTLDRSVAAAAPPLGR
ncbi:hypothetical protein ACFFX0_29335 [Citricoccus parietis]|uniref:Uncharacterized protein n=1 Tax=Citricoccus parietis TaxID=592307 RepID=A0ABV5G5E6_9MICC